MEGEGAEERAVYKQRALLSEKDVTAKSEVLGETYEADDPFVPLKYKN